MPRLLSIGILLATSTAYAQDAPRLAVVGLHQSEVNAEAQEQLVSDLVEAVDATGKADGLDTEEFVVAITGREEIILKQALLGAGQDALANGKNLYNQAQTEDAIYELQVAVEQLGMAVGATNTTTDLWEAWSTWPRPISPPTIKRLPTSASARPRPSTPVGSPTAPSSHPTWSKPTRPPETP